MLLDRIKEIEDITDSERIFIDWILMNKRSIIDYSIHEIARINFISASTIVRFCKKLGFSGYLQFKAQYISEYQEAQRLDMMLKERPFDANSELDEVIHTLPLIYYRSIDFAKSAIDKDTIIRCMKHIKEADLITVYGNSINKHLAEMFAYKLEEVGKMVIVYDSSHWQAIDYWWNTSQKVFAILLSHSANNVMIVDVAKRLRAAGVKKLLISSRNESELHTYCEEHLQIIKTKNTLEFSNTIYSISMQYILDVFVALMLVENYEHINQATKSVYNI